jgi:hypothetical protein
VESFLFVIINNIVNSFKQSSKSNNPTSKTDRKSLQMSSDYASQTSKEKRTKVPELKFPVVGSLDLMSRSSRRADFSKSGGSTSGHTNIFNRSNKY